MAGQQSNGRGESLLTPRRIVAAVVLLLFVVFALLNTTQIAVQLLLLEVTGPLWLTLLLSFLLGALVAWLLLTRRRR